MRCGTVTVVSKLGTTTKSVRKTSVATTTPIRSRSCLGTTTRTLTLLRWFVPLSTSLRTADYSFSLESAWGEHTGLCRFRHGHVNTLTCTLFSAFRGEKGAFVCPGVFWSRRIQQGKRLFLPVKMVRQERDAARKKQGCIVVCARFSQNRHILEQPQEMFVKQLSISCPCNTRSFCL